MHYYVSCLKKYAMFNGRSRRAEFWIFSLVNLIIGSILGALAARMPYPVTFIFVAISSVYGLALFLPNLAVGIRRLHDIGKSGFWIFLAFIPLVGWIWLIILYCMPGTAGNNKYGADPKAGEAVAH